MGAKTPGVTDQLSCPVLVEDGTMCRQPSSPPGPTGVITSATGGGGLGSVVTIQGKTAVRLGGTDFFITGTSKEEMFGSGWRPSGGSNSVLFIYKKDNPTKLYRLDWDTLKSGPRAGEEGWEHNQRGVAEILKLEVVNHQPAGTLGSFAGQTITVFKWGGRAMLVVGVAFSAWDIYKAQNKPREVVGQVGGWTGAVAGGSAFAEGGAEVGAVFGAVPGAVAGALIGGVVGGAGGFFVGYHGSKIVYDWVFQQLEKEEYIIKSSL